MVFNAYYYLSIKKTVCVFNVGLLFIDLLSLYVAANVPELLSIATGLVHMLDLMIVAAILENLSATIPPMY